ncbi:MAG: hypothetical protein IPL27_02005 [Lewinellaceae bacterium]|nr:hypothetical protein [Lewinellaceae bacterium]
MSTFKKISIFTVFALFLSLLSASTASAQTTEKGVTIIELIQTPGIFTTQELNLRPGKYQFRIVNQNVDHELGFVIQKSADTGKDVSKFHVADSFASKTVKAGEAAYTGVVDLTEGDYSYVCPLNPTPHYKIKVK